MGWIAPVASAVASIGGLIFGLKGNKKKDDEGSPSLPAEPRPELAAEKARQEQLEERRKAFGRRKTILSNETGVAPVEKKTLLGG